MIYFDTAYILKCYILEPGSEQVRALLERTGAAACCAFGRLELASAIRRVVREGRLDPRAAPTAYTVLNRDDEHGIWTWLPLTPHLVESAAQSIRSVPDGVFLRAGDALHLACAREHGCTEVYTNDRHMLAASRSFGLNAINVIP